MGSLTAQSITLSRPLPLYQLTRADHAVSLGLIIRYQAANFWEYTIALTYDEDVREAKAVCMGLSSKEAKRFAFAIQQSSTSAHHPLCLPMILLDISVEELCRYVESRVRDKNRNQEALGMDTYIDRGFAANLTRPRNQDLLDRDLGEMTQRLTSLSHSATGLQCNARAKIEEIEFLSAISNGMATVSNAKSLTAIRRAFDDRLEYCRQRVKAVQGEIELVLKANEAQQQTVSEDVEGQGNGLADEFHRFTVSLHNETAPIVYRQRFSPRKLKKLLCSHRNKGWR